ncbi:MAG: glycoside hydrolase family 127 protein [Promethearchaeota archaeon]|nr:MAG: glycoside hydrolase family 127 protein [Candidatus Lokiarchaeota archaeon]
MRQFDYEIQPIPLRTVKITDNFWKYRIETNRKVTIPYALKKCEETHRIDNFSKAGGLIDDDIKPNLPYNDSDVFKIIEGAAYSLSVKRDPQLEKYIDEIIRKIAAAQEEDGYLYTTRTINPKRPHLFAGRKRWKKVSTTSHELYNMGHLYESAIAYYQATGKRVLLDVAIRSSELIDKVFGPGKNESTPGHQEIEIGLIRLYRVIGDEKYLKLAKFFLDVRGPNGYEYNQTHKKVIEQDEAVGHAVRATYMYSGMTDIAALTNNKDYIKAIDRIWDNVVSKKLSITGGIGSNIKLEAFGNNYELPNMATYNETCASIGNVYWNHRLFLLHGDGKYFDVIERTLFNGLISGISLEGKSFFYPNPLASDGQYSRSPWFDTSCCPSNLTRFMASIPSYIYAQKDDILYVNLFIGSAATVFIDEKPVVITQETDYPWNGIVKIIMNVQESSDFTIAIRIPGWTQNRPVPSDLYLYLNESNEEVNLKVNNNSIDFINEKGFACIRRTWRDGDTIEFKMPMPIRRVVAHEKVKNNLGRVALERGPIVYCVEGIDNKVDHVFNLFLDDADNLTSVYHKDMLNGIVVITGAIHYLKNGENEKVEKDFLAIPYYAWAHRGKGEMTVWLIRDLKAYKSSKLASK